ncbi:MULTISPECIES: hypothetical protein [Olivibacter]|uniref:Adenylosuccinate lyase n=2 Tax=Sphingobacteriaceae TaxID=84566 RepID=F4CEC1_SPHS2|nr:hypothetical protein [Olivibacter sp. LS-1]QEL01009.1 hypothetical protein FKG96_09375 [Olivibacter sp. LS-1]
MIILSLHGMTKEQFLLEISKNVSKVKATVLAQLAISDHYTMSDLLSLCYHPQKAIAFRAAWILEFVENKSPDRFIPLLVEFIEQLTHQHNASCQRHFTKILMNYTNRKAKTIRKEAFSQLTTTHKEQVVERVFEWLIKSETPVAVRVNCIEILYNLVPLFPWIKDELNAQITFYLKDGSAAMQSRGKKLLMKLLEAS